MDVAEGGEIIDSDWEIDYAKEDKLDLPKRLQLLWHARKCLDREVRRKGDTWECEYYRCREFVQVLKHYTFCQSASDCPIPYCRQTRKILLHREHCELENCKYCTPPEKEGRREAYENTKDWHQSVTDDHKYHLRYLLSLATFSKLRDPDLNGVSELEDEFFNDANSLTEYYHLLAEEICQQEMTEKEDEEEEENDDEEEWGDDEVEGGDDEVEGGDDEEDDDQEEEGDDEEEEL